MSDRGKVFIVGDDALTAEVLREILENDGYSVESVTRGEGSFAAITASEPNLVMLDTRLPDDDPFAPQILLPDRITGERCRTIGLAHRGAEATRQREPDEDSRHQEQQHHDDEQDTPTHVGIVTGPAYTAAKHAMNAMNESLNMEAGLHGVRACAICPGEVV